MTWLRLRPGRRRRPRCSSPPTTAAFPPTAAIPPGRCSPGFGGAGVTAEVEIHIEKRLPVQGGLGAGSGNAVAALMGLEQELGIASQRVSLSHQRACPSVARRFERHAELADAPLGNRRPGWLRCAAVSHRRNGAGPGSRAGGLSASRYRARLVRGRRSRDRRLHAAGLSRLGRALRRRGFDRGGRCR